MGQQQALQKKMSSPSMISIPQGGYRVMNLNDEINEEQNLLNIMTDYVIGQDPRLLDLKQVFEKNQGLVQFEVFSILNYKIRKVNLNIKLNTSQEPDQIQQSIYKQNGSKFMYKQFTIGVNFKHYNKINDCILRISKVFKNSPLQQVNIKKDQYIVGIVEGQFQSMKDFVDLLKNLINLKFQFITLGICDSQGKTRLQKIGTQDLQKWNQSYGVGYLGVQLAQGWLNKWQFKKHIESKRKKQTKKLELSTKSKEQNKNFPQKLEQKQIQTKNLNQNEKFLEKQVDIYRQYNKEAHQQIKKLQQNEKNKLASQQSLSKPIQSLNNKIQQTSFQHLSKQVSCDLQSIQKKAEIQIVKQRNTTKSNNIDQVQQSNSQISSQQIQQKCNELLYKNEQNNPKGGNIIKKTKSIIQINFKDDASTICMCKDYSKHCEKCFKQKQGNYYFFNKKTNKIILIEKSMLFPKIN